jgi:hypothetical protein
VLNHARSRCFFANVPTAPFFLFLLPYPAPETFNLAMSHDSAQEDITPLHPANIRAVPYPDARVTLANLPKEQSQLNDLSATVLSITSAKSSSGAIKVPLLPPPFRLPPPSSHARPITSHYRTAPREVGPRRQARQHPRVHVQQDIEEIACRRQQANRYFHRTSRSDA